MRVENPILELREFIAFPRLSIDGRMIPYQLITAFHYFMAKNPGWTEDDYEKFMDDDNNLKIYERVTQIMALKQACVLLRHTSHSDGSLSGSLFELREELEKTAG